MYHSLLLLTISSDKLSDVVHAFLSAPDVLGLFGPNDLSCRFTGAKFSRDNDRAHGSTTVVTGVNIVFGYKAYERFTTFVEFGIDCAAGFADAGANGDTVALAGGEHC